MSRVASPVTTEALWQEARRVRQVVFVEEQRCPPEEEWDALRRLGAAARRSTSSCRWTARPPAPRAGLCRTTTDSPVAHLGRFALLPAFRGRGLGRALVEHVAARAAAAGYAKQFLAAQAHLEAFYAGFGFARCGADFWEAGILHTPMCRG